MSELGSKSCHSQKQTLQVSFTSALLIAVVVTMLSCLSIGLLAPSVSPMVERATASHYPLAIALSTQKTREKVSTEDLTQLLLEPSVIKFQKSFGTYEAENYPLLSLRPSY
jgi:hypothetical protein